MKGTLLGARFELLGELGRGGTATVWMAHDRVRDERIALKVVHAHLADSGSVRKRLAREVRASGRIRHPNALVARELHDLDGVLAMALPLHTGRELADVAPLSPGKVERLARQLLGALGEAHRAGVVHRDISPHNVLVDADGAVLTDFGIARIEGEHTAGTVALGTAGFTAPEIYEGARGDTRSDLYSLGCVLYFALTGKAPFGADNPMSVLRRQLAEDFEPLSGEGPLQDAVHAMLRRSPRRRLQGCGDALLALDAIREEPANRVQLPPGRWGVLVTEAATDYQRREELRTGEKKGFADPLSAVVQRVTGWLGIDPPGGPAPEELLARAVASAAGSPDAPITLQPAVYDASFRLVDDVDPSTAQRMANAARAAGFDVQLFMTPGRVEVRGVGTAVLGLLTAAGLMGGNIVSAGVLAVLTVVWHVRLFRLVDERLQLAPPWQRALPLAFEAERAELTDLLSRTLGQLDRLDALVAEADLPAIVEGDLRRCSARLRKRTEALGALVATLQTEAAEPLPDGVITQLEARLRRARTLGSGEASALEAALDAHQARLRDADEAEQHKVAAMAGLVEIGAAAQRVCVQLGLRGSPSVPGPMVEALQRQAALAEQALAEVSGQRAD